jgi:transposase IS4-like protein
VYHTNIAAKRDTTANQAWKDITDLEIRRWVACRLEMITTLASKSEIQDFWSGNHRSIAVLSCQRFKAIERYICIDSQPEEPATAKSPAQWYWKVQTALDVVRTQFRLLLIPGSHICVDESIIKFYGHKTDTFKVPHKPAKEGFLLYVLASHGGLVHDFVVVSSQTGIEAVPTGITLDIPTKSLRKRKRGATGMTATEINLPAIKSTVYTLCERVTAEYRQEQFVCFVDNLFVNIPLARALLTINIGICGTTRKNALGIPLVLLAIQHRFPELLPDNQVTTCILDDLINVTT